MDDFATRLRARVTAAGNALCVGIDPPIAATEGFFAEQRERLGQAGFLARFSATMVEAAAGVAPAVKVQSAFFEACGAPGFDELRHALRLAKDKGLFTVLDAKRGDIASTMGAYGRMAFDVMDADALTVTPYMGFDVAKPLVPWLKAGRGIYLVWVSSNASGRAVQDPIATELLAQFSRGFTDCGVPGSYGLVLGATKLDEMEPTLRATAETLPLLLPGVGAQGAVVTPSLLRSVAVSGASLVPISRGLSDLVANRVIRSWDDFGRDVFTRVRTAAASLVGP